MRLTPGSITKLSSAIVAIIIASFLSVSGAVAAPKNEPTQFVGPSLILAQTSQKDRPAKAGHKKKQARDKCLYPYLRKSDLGRKYMHRYKRVMWRHKHRGTTSPGRNIVCFGLDDKHKYGKKKLRVEVRESSDRMYLWLNPPVVPATPAAPTSAGTGSVPPSGSAPSSSLQAIAACESGGDPTAVSPGGLYRGKYQFDQQTWESVGGVGDPAAAPEAEQDARAQALMAQRGSSPWPVCG